jgi:hypothetical protein
MISSRTTSLLIRVLYAALVVYAAVRGDHGAVIFHGAVFLGSLVVWAVPDRRVLWFDALLVGLFAVTLLGGYFGFVMKSTIIGWDKLFHFLAGVALAGIAACSFPRGALNRRDWSLTVFTLAFVVFAGWEVYEWFAFEFIGRQGIMTLTDSLLDFVADSLGAVLVLWRFRT